MTVNGEILSVDRVVAVVRDDRVIEIDELLAIDAIDYYNS